jgi:N-acetylglutamate synthase-like GNAT family acetyltransferase
MPTARGAFDPEVLVLLRAVFNEACLALSPDQHTQSMRSTLVQRLLKRAREGERDPVRLRAYALMEVASLMTTSRAS